MRLCSPRAQVRAVWGWLFAGGTLHFLRSVILVCLPSIYENGMYRDLFAVIFEQYPHGSGSERCMLLDRI